MSERWQVIWAAIRCGLGLGPRRNVHRVDVSYMPAKQFDELMRTLETPDDISGWVPE